MNTADFRWQRVNGLFHAALALAPAERALFLANSCGDLRADVESLLGAHASGAALSRHSCIGRRIGHYEITAFVAAGGMGEVYRARDTQLGREVALKILPPAFESDPDRRARFDREARVLASLSHPNVATIFGLVQGDGVSALALEFVEGDTLADRIGRGTIPLAQALSIAKQIADALEAAHEQGIIHRDLKPANIKFTKDGTVKVLDFGLARLAEPMTAFASVAPTVAGTYAASGAPVLLGTPAYMSPEQARGEPADKRSDIWAFGCVLFEMLTGKGAFAAANVADTLAAVLVREPDLSSLPAATPANVGTLLKGCLEKDRRDRFGDVSVVRFLLRNASDVAPVSRTTPANPWRHRALYIVLAVILAMVAGGAAWFAKRPTEPRVSRLVIAPAGAAALSINGNLRDIAITPDGSRVVYAGNNGTELFVRALDALEPISIYKGTPRGPFISPDGQWVGFFDEFTTLKKVAITGGPAITLTKIDGSASRGATWTPDDTIVFATNSTDTGIQAVSAGGGTATVVTRPDHGSGEQDHFWPELLPDGQTVLFTISAQMGPADADQRDAAAQVATLNLRTRNRKVLIRGGSHAHYSSSGHLVYAAAGVLRAIAFDAATLSTRGDSVPVITNVQMTGPGGVDAFSARDGTLAYVPGGVAPILSTLVWVDRQQKETVIPAPPLNYVYPRLSPDGTRIAVWRGQGDIWLWDLSRSLLSRLTFNSVSQMFPVWTPDGRRLIFSSRRSTDSQSRNIFWQASDGTGGAERLTESAHQQDPTAITPDGTHVIFTEASSETGDDIMQLQLGAERRVTPLIRTSFSERNGVVSPDGRWIAYQADDSGRGEIYVRPYPDVNGGHWQVSTAGGGQPLWSRDGRELFYVSNAGFMRAGIQSGISWAATTPILMVPAPIAVGGTLNPSGYRIRGPLITGRTYDISADGQRLLVVKGVASAPDTTPRQIVVVQHFDQELKRLVPAN